MLRDSIVVTDSDFDVKWTCVEGFKFVLIRLLQLGVPSNEHKPPRRGLGGST